MLTPAQIKRARALNEKGVPPATIGKSLGVPPVAVIRRLKLRSAGLTGEQIGEIRDRFAAGELQSDLAREYGISQSTACRFCEGVRRTPEARARAFGRSAAVQTNPVNIQKARDAARSSYEAESAKRAAQLVAEVFEIPAWVPPRLRGLYAMTARNQDGHAAASLCRRLKASGAGACR